ncbi:CHASE3 domain-containing protein [Saccharothrix violaceirubra]|uniref:histidine kinase n=1 Tax=Saccharothrix violaceirubra TaxID=413306 RepID=A0A7W7T1D8_9PSEU|nr:sensor histidine kinase [Saccharothrix violaceirubra]MBB4964783.1 signal transduction histidine kinase [Saccharothrix violaceirubra]
MTDYRTRWPASRLLIAAVTILIIVSASAITAIAVALADLTEARVEVLDEIGPTRRLVIELEGTLVDQETGVRGFALTANPDFLTPYSNGQDAEKQIEDAARAAIRTARPDLALRLDDIAALSSAWRLEFAEPLIVQVHAAGSPQLVANDTERGKALFDRVRNALSALRGDLNTAFDASRDRLDEVADQVLYLSIGLGALLVVIIAGVAIVLYRILIAPLTGLAAQVRRVSAGDFTHEVDVNGPRETVMLGQDVDTMRTRILRDVEELRRSNAELEQFAYVASHDLQEPLRKVASFCQLLERRYSGQLDERGEQYLRFAVDGAKRMQVLINDLLAFSRVGRITREQTVVDCAELVRQVLDNQSETIERLGAVVEVGELPSVRGEGSLLGGVFGNLIGNALKFHGTEPPLVRVSAQRTGEFWTFTVSDNGIGIEPEYAERVFVIFQRLHHKDDYPGTGIGLAMCRKIVEYHGGTIWLASDREAGTTFEFTLPVVEDVQDE